MIRRILRLFRRRATVATEYPRATPDVLIARRALRLHNRDSKGAAAFERVHTILNNGR